MIGAKVSRSYAMQKQLNRLYYMQAYLKKITSMLAYKVSFIRQWKASHYLSGIYSKDNNGRSASQIPSSSRHRVMEEQACSCSL